MPIQFRDSQDILDSIRRIVRALRLASRRAEARFGLSGAQLFVLQTLKDGSRLTINEIGERTFTHQSTVSGIVSKLAAAGLLARARSRRDARRRQVRITPKGAALLSRRIELGQSRLLAGISRLPAGERRRLSELLARLVKEAGFADIPAKMFFEEDKR